MVSSWILAIDFGTSYTVAAARVGDRPPEVIEVGGERRVPSVVLVDEHDGILVGRPADDLSVTHPANALRAIKNRLGDQLPVVLAGRPHNVVHLVAALLRDAYVQSVRQMGEPPSEVRLTHPATWSLPRMKRLLEAAEKAELPNTVLVSEPVAAALSYAHEVGLEMGQNIAVYDLGGGTFDAAVVTSQGGEYVIAGRPLGDQNIGGELFDEVLVNAIGDQLDPDVWHSILAGEDTTWQQVGLTLRNEARKAKEALSSHHYVNVIVPLPTAGLWQTRLTRDEFEALVRPHVAETIVLLERCVAEAGLDASQLAGISLVGGSSRSPLVEEMVRESFPTVPVSRRGDPKAAVAMGATRAFGRAVLASPRPGERNTQEASPGTAPQDVRLAPPSSNPPLAPPLAGGSNPPPPPPPPSNPPVLSAPTPAAPKVSIPPPISVPPVAPTAAAAAVATVRGDAFAGGPTISDTPETSAASRRSRRPALIAAGALVVAAIVAGVIVVATRGGDDGSPSRVLGDRIVEIPGSYGTLWDVAFSPNGDRIVTAADDGTAHIYDTETAEPVATLTGHEGTVRTAQFSPDGTRIVTASDDGSARVWDVESGEEIFPLTAHEGAVTDAEFSPDGNWVVTASADGTAKVWNVGGSEADHIASMKGHDGDVVSAHFSPDGQTVVTAGIDATARLWEASSGIPLYTLSGHAAALTGAVFNDDGTRVISSSDDGTAKVWDPSTGDELWVLAGHSGSVYAASFSPDGTKAVTASDDQTTKVWDLSTANEIETLTGHEAGVYRAEFNPDGDLVLTASFDGTARVWDVGDGSQLAMMNPDDGHVIAAHFDRGGGTIATTSEGGEANVWAG